MGQEIQPHNSHNGDDDNQPHHNDDNNNGQKMTGYDIWQSIGFFSGDELMSFIFKKTEKITSALYLISSLLKDTEPIKWELREKGINLLLSTIAANNSEPIDKNAVIQSFFTDSLETLSLLNVAFLSGLISDMNHAVIVRELEAVVSLLKTKVFEGAAKAGYILSDSFFRTDQSLSRTTDVPRVDARTDVRQDLRPITDTPHSNQKNTLKAEYSTDKGQKEKPPVSRERGVKVAVKDKKDGRKAAIIGLLKKKSHLTIKDFSEAIRGCSEKTIQRELLDLVAKGVVEKEGERRWSRYSLA
jgi:DNA-binding transcriptional ArsR family regulator